ncbi:MAG: tripartite tricarboxylate transporter substrate-binding protein [Rubrivivax sp.]
MKTSPLRRRHVLAALALPAAGPLRAQAPFPSRAIRVVVPWAPGGLVDTGGRVVAEALSKAFGQPATAENVPGAAGTLGADQVAKAAADGHVLLMGTSSIAIDVAGQRRMPFDPLRDLAPVALVADTPSIVVVPVASPARTLAELLAAAKARPGELNYGTPGVGSPAHLFTELLAQSAGLQLTHVPYGRSPAINDLMGGRLQLMVATGPSSLPQIRGGQLRALAVTSRQRFAALPDVPTVAEAGVPGYEAGQWLGVFAPAATPKDTVQRIAAAVAQAVATPAVAQLLSQRGLEPHAGGPEDLARALAADIRKWGQVMKAAAIRLEG